MTNAEKPLTSPRNGELNVVIVETIQPMNAMMLLLKWQNGKTNSINL